MVKECDSVSLGRVGVLSQERTARGESLYGDDQRE